MTQTQDVAAPIVKQIDYHSAVADQLQQGPESEQQFLLTYPTVYVIEDEAAVYVGETNNIQNRTAQHLNEDPKKREDWQAFKNHQNVNMIVIGHEHFNKSLTLDVENQLMLYLSGNEYLGHLLLNNRRENPQGAYYPVEEKDAIFGKVWDKLHQINATIFPLEQIIKNTALYKASPFHRLTDEQLTARDQIFTRVMTALQKQTQGQLILIQGEAGSGKTVLLSTLFVELLGQLTKQGQFRDDDATRPLLSAYLLINHDQQLKVYQQIMTTLRLFKVKDLPKKQAERVTKPTHFIYSHDPKEPVDVVLVDESHLLWTQGKQSYKGDNQLFDLLKRARVVIAVFDQHQVLRSNGYWEPKTLQKIQALAQQDDNLITLKNQLRIKAGPATVKWLKQLTHEQLVTPMPAQDQDDFDLKVFASPQAMYEAIKRKATHQEAGLSRVLATFDWAYNQKAPADRPYWTVKTADFEQPWNLQLKYDGADHKQINQLAWAEQPQTIDEVGSTYTIQGFDLNYTGVIIGPSVEYRNGKIQFNPDKSSNRQAIMKRTFADKSKNDVSAELLQNELNVLLTRGVHGLYLYAVDPELQRALLQAQVAGQVELKVAEDDGEYRE
ncbi:DUF2075 domain-containing protein [Loigolactobacillus bifermentans]|uniref:GIY-YIG domain-containing protein n=1 Tax=Loigolactobacillus bifermentans DSM 20003 TaxID=1423726 RepID=A0A0R1GRP6_9LACO|nr:DUF2075 domain-containing protein [Loigolactobacillus bifermentans]KRK34545.1 hypothetical protein FC07_GL000559 [Loigolactobacillus bifermentans DSM 20003]QGG61321.1 DUF2075 domain-containing protein [Loigolactobacillus bifermentans]